MFEYVPMGSPSTVFNPATDLATVMNGDTPTRAAYTFDGWNLESDGSGSPLDPVATIDLGNVTYYAKWDAIVYDIIYDLNDTPEYPAIETDPVSDYPETYDYESCTFPLHIGDLERKGYTFLGYTAADGFIQTHPTKPFSIRQGTIGMVALTANWTAIEYKITYELGGGTNDSTNPAAYTADDTRLDIEKPTKEGFTFDGWTAAPAASSTDPGLTVSAPETDLAIPPGAYGDITLTAHWTANPYNITYELRGGTNSDGNPQTYTAESTFPFNITDPTRMGFTFDGWTAEPTQPIDKGILVLTKTRNLAIPLGTLGDITLTAHWTAIEYAIDYDLDGGTNDDGNPKTYTAESTFPITIAKPTKQGFTFDGWTAAPADSSTTDSGLTVTVPETDLAIPADTYGDITFTAHWTRVKSPASPGGSGGSVGSGTGSNTVPSAVPNKVPEKDALDADESPLDKEKFIWYIQGDDHKYARADNPITRAEVSMAFYRLLADTNKDAPVIGKFPDVLSGKWYAQAVNRLTEIGVISGYPDGTFGPEEYITRAELITIIARFERLSPGGELPFPDVADTYWARSYVAAVYDKGWIHGYPNGTFAPDADILRSEAVKLINGEIGRKYDSAKLPKVSPFPDFSTSHWAYGEIIVASPFGEFCIVEKNQR
jgi:uncharacterized repeat protein (TIGR02543 family)